MNNFGKVILSANRIASFFFGAYAILSLFASGALVLMNAAIFVIFRLNILLLTTSTVRSKAYLDRYKLYKLAAILGSISIIIFYSWVPARVLLGQKPQYFNPASYIFFIVILLVLIPSIMYVYKTTLTLESENKSK